MHKGNTVVMTADAVDNYGEEWAGVEFIVDHVAYHYMPSEQFFARGMPEGYHPGYDPAAQGQPLCDLSEKENGREFGASLYGYELRIVN